MNARSTGRVESILLDRVLVRPPTSWVDSGGSLLNYLLNYVLNYVLNQSRTSRADQQVGPTTRLQLSRPDRLIRTVDVLPEIDRGFGGRKTATIEGNTLQ